MRKLWQGQRDRNVPVAYAGAMRWVMIVLLLGSPVWADLPQGWLLFTSSPQWYQGQRDKGLARAGSASGLLEGSPAATTSSYALLTQKISAMDYRGHKVRLSAYLAVTKVAGRAGLWIRVDDRQGQALAFDNMQDRPPFRGDQTWQEVSIEVEVPPEAAEIHYGLLLQGGGKAHVDGLALTPLGSTSPTARARAKVRALPRAPVNGDFER